MVWDGLMRSCACPTARCGGRSGGGGGLFSGLIPFDRFGHGRQRARQHIAHVGHWNNLQPFLHIVWDLGEILFVFLRDQHCLDPTAQRRQQFFLQTANRHCIATQRHLARHGNIAAHRNTG